MCYSLGIDLGGSSIKAVAVRKDGATLETVNVAFDPSLPQDWAAQIRQLVGRFQDRFGARAASIGLSAPGLPGPAGRTIAYLPGRLEGLVGLDWTRHLGAELPIPVLNDAQAALLGEAWLGAARGFENAILLTLGTGVGGAILAGGRLLPGHTGKAGHLGHICLDIDGAPDICGTPGSLELMIGNCSIVERTGGKFKTTHELLDAHRAGDAQASSIWLRSVKALACAIASFTNILDPEAVILGGGIARAGLLLFEPLEQMLRTMEWQVCNHQVKLLPAQLGDLAGAYGAAWRGLQISS